MDETIRTIRKEVRSFKGIEYQLVLNCVGDQKETKAEEKNDIQWWCVEYTDKSKKLAMSAFVGCLYYDSRFMLGARMMDKYHHCELQAMGVINYMCDKFLWERTKQFSKEVKFYFYVVARLFFPMVITKIKSLFKSKSEAQEIIDNLENEKRKMDKPLGKGKEEVKN